MGGQRNKKKKKNNNDMTFIIIPRITARPVKITTSRTHVYLAVLAAVILAIGSLVLGGVYYSRQAEFQGIDMLKQEIAEKDKKIQSLGEQIEEIQKQKDDIEKKQEEIKRLMGLTVERNRYSEPSRGGRENGDAGLMNEEEKDFYSQAQEIKEALALEEKELEELIARVNSQKDYFRSIPNQWPVEGEITSPYGWRSSPFGGGGQYFHDGIDIANDPGAEVVSAGDGVVIFAGWQGVYGKTVIIDHGTGYVTKYGHNSALLVGKGDQVKKGEPIAYLGNTGRSTGPHLHFSIFKWNEPQDPMLYLP